MPEFEKAYSSDSEKKTSVAKKPQKKNLFIGIVSGLFPWKGDTAGNIARKLVFFTSLVLIIAASISLINYYFIREIELESEKESWAELLEKYSNEEKITINMPADIETSQSGKEESVEVIGDYYGFYEENDDFVGYIKIYPIINYPVYQTTDNNFYLKHNYKKEPAENGAVFADFEVPFTQTSRPNNIIIYGHNLRQAKHFFQPLMNYVNDPNYIREHPTIDFDTLYERGTYKIFSVFVTNTEEMHGEIFDYWNNVTFENKAEFDNFAAECLDRSYYYTGVDLKYGDELLTLSTCFFDMFDELRLVVAARRVRENESPLVDAEAFIDNSKTENGFVQRKMFEAYYETFAENGWSGRNWDLNYIKDFKNNKIDN